MISSKKEILLLVYFFGHGIMLSEQIADYKMRLEKHTKDKTYELIRELSNEGYIDIFKVNIFNCVKLKKPAMTLILDKHYSTFKSIEKTKFKIKKTIIINAAILKRGWDFNSVIDLYNHIMYESTYLYKRNSSHLFLERFEEKNIQREIDFLTKQIKDTDEIIEYGNMTKSPFDFNNLLYNNMLITKVTQNEVRVAIIDVNNNLLTVAKKNNFALLMIEAFNYLNFLFERKIHFVFVGIDSYTDEKFDEINPYIQSRLASNQLIGAFKISKTKLQNVEKYFCGAKLI